MTSYEKGITIKFRGDSTALDKALGQIRRETKDLNTELKSVDRALKFNPTNVDLWRQKQQLLTQKISETDEKLKVLKDAQTDMDARGVDHASTEYRNLERQIIETESQLKNFKAKLREIGNVKLKALSNQIKEVGNNLTKAGEAAKPFSKAGAVVAGALGATAYSAGKAADDINTMSKIYGLSTKDLQIYAAAAEQVDVSVETIAKSHVKLEKSMLSAQQGSKNQKAAFEALGVSIQNADGSLRNGDAVWQDTIKALGSMSNETERDAYAMQLMGKSATELNPLIEDNGETYKRVSELFTKYGLEPIDQETIDKANEFNDALDDIKSIGGIAFQIVGAKLAEKLAPYLEKGVDLVGRFAEWLTNLDPKVLAIVGSIAAVVAVLAPVLMFLGQLAFSISSIISLVGTIGPMIAGLAGPIALAIGIIAMLVALGIGLYKNWDTIKAKAQELWNAIKTVFTAIGNFFVSIFTFWKTLFTTVWEGIVATVKWYINAVATTIKTVFNGIKATAQFIWNAIKAIIQLAWNLILVLVRARINLMQTIIMTVFNSIKAGATAVWNGIKKAIVHPIQTAVEVVRAAINKIKKIINGAHLSLPKFKLPHFKVSGGKLPWGIGGKGVAPKINVDWYAQGGIFSKPTLAGIGEDGAEAVVPLDTLWRKLDAIAEASQGGGDINIYINGYNRDPRELAEEIERIIISKAKNRRMVWQ